MEANTQTQVNGGAGASASATDSNKKIVREATAEEKRFAAHIKQIPHNLFKTIVYFI